MKKPIASIEYPNCQSAFVARTLPWDGAIGGQADTILQYTGHANKKLVWNFSSPPLHSRPSWLNVSKARNVSQSTPTYSPTLCLIILPCYVDNIHNLWCICSLAYPEGPHALCTHSRLCDKLSLPCCPLCPFDNYYCTHRITISPYHYTHLDS